MPASFFLDSCLFFSLDGCLSFYLTVSVLLSEKLGLGQKSHLMFTFKNPLPEEMNDVVLSIDVDGMKDGKVWLCCWTRAWVLGQ